MLKIFFTKVYNRNKESDELTTWFFLVWFLTFLFQIEEQAMQELMFQYAAQSNIDEYITVRRISRAMATPMWRATSHRH